MKQMIIKQIIEKLSGKSKTTNTPKDFRIGKDLITECSASEDINVRSIIERNAYEIFPFDKVKYQR